MTEQAGTGTIARRMALDAFFQNRALENAQFKKYEEGGLSLLVKNGVLIVDDSRVSETKKLFLNKRLRVAFGEEALGNLAGPELIKIARNLKTWRYLHQDDRATDLILTAEAEGNKKGLEKDKKRMRIIEKLKKIGISGISEKRGEKEDRAEFGLEILLKEMGFETAVKALSLFGEIRQREAGERIAKKTATG